MKKLSKFLILILSINTFAEEEVLYCVEEEKVGFQPEEEYRQTNFTPKRFTAKVDFVNESFYAEDIYFQFGVECKTAFAQSLDCRNTYGTFKLLKNKLKFVRTSTYVPDSVFIAHGYCESF